MKETKELIQARTEYFNAKEKLFTILLNETYEDQVRGDLEESIQTQQQTNTKCPKINPNNAVDSSKPQTPNNQKQKKGYPVNPEYICPDCGGTDLKAPLFSKNIICKKCKREAPRDSPIWKNNEVQ